MKKQSDDRYNKGVPIYENFGHVKSGDISSIMNVFYSSGCFLDNFGCGSPQKAFFRIAVNKFDRQLVIVPDYYKSKAVKIWFDTLRGQPLDNSFRDAPGLKCTKSSDGVDVFWILNGWSVIVCRETPIVREIVELIDDFGKRVQLTSDALDYYRRIMGLLTSERFSQQIGYPIRAFLWFHDRITDIKRKLHIGN